MDDKNAFERQLSVEVAGLMGPVRPVDDLAVFSAITTTTQSPKWRFQSMFSATKFVVAGTIVALFGGFLLSGVLTQPSEEQLPAAGASASASIEVAPTAEATPESEPVPEATEVPQSDSDPLPGVFTPTGSLDRGRDSHTATVLPDGRVLVVGGSEYSEGMDYVTSAEAWDPIKGSFSPAGSLAEGRWAHTATLLTDGRVLIAGGSDNVLGFATGLASAEIWDPATESFSPAGSLVERRGLHTATPLTDGRVLVVGGVVVDPADRFLASAEIWDPATESFSPAAPLDARRVFHTATLLPDGRVLVVGGTGQGNDPGGFPASAEIWDPATESFSPAGSLARGRSRHTANLLPDGRVLIVGGRDADGTASAEIWDPGTESFSFAKALADGRYRHDATLLRDGRVLIVGGAGPLPLVRSSEMEIWDPVTDSLVPAASPIEEREGYSFTSLPDGRALLVGGRGANGALASAEVWEPGERPSKADDVATTTTPALLPGVDLVTEEVEPGVYRVFSDGVRDLSREIGAHPWFDRERNMAYVLDAVNSDISIAPDGSVWYFGPDGSYRIGDASQAISDQSEPLVVRSIEWAPDDTAWGIAGQLVSFSDGSWTIHEDFPLAQRVEAVEVTPDGIVWAVSGSDKKARVSRLDADGWTNITGVRRLDVSSAGGIMSLKPGHDGDVWLLVRRVAANPALAHFDGSEWSIHEPDGIPAGSRPYLIDVAADGSLWAYFAHSGGDYTGTGYVGRYQDGEWTVSDPEDGVPEAGGPAFGLGWPALMEAAPDGRLWLTLRGDAEQTGTGCDGVASFDGQTWTRFLAGQCVYGLDAAEDGTLWLLAGQPRRGDDGGNGGPIRTYVITPEAVAATE